MKTFNDCKEGDLAYCLTSGNTVSTVYIKKLTKYTDRDKFFPDIEYIEYDVQYDTGCKARVSGNSSYSTYGTSSCLVFLNKEELREVLNNRKHKMEYRYKLIFAQ